MGQVHVEASRVIYARPEAVYAVLADYRDGHPHILPKQYFKELTVEEGGVGAGTVFTVRLSIFGVEQTYHMIVSEPEPGRVMIETDEEAGAMTTFTVEPVADGARSRVSMVADVTTASGVRGLAEQLLTPLLLSRVLRAEVKQLKEYMESQA